MPNSDSTCLPLAEGAGEEEPLVALDGAELVEEVEPVPALEASGAASPLLSKDPNSWATWLPLAVGAEVVAEVACLCRGLLGMAFEAWLFSAPAVGLVAVVVGGGVARIGALSGCDGAGAGA